MKKGQGTLEYLLIIAVSLVIILFTIRAVMNAVESVPEVEVWTAEGAKVVILKVHYDAGGRFIPDIFDLNDEYVVLKNIGDEPANLTGWKLLGNGRRSRRHPFIFPPFVLQPGATVTIHTGRGTNTETDLYWGMRRPVWRNRGDTAYLYDSHGNLVDMCSWRGRGRGEVICHTS
ncbi:lamin tail domain-containing protein [Thermococcus sp.]|uniref:lamin tail domain-containing protein n=1 Tax=Thermococcus sp. TaxID=35749 RepID=UPI0026172879|nr:lamin tail domain-containing protein [Thermococcus sp.]